MTIGFSITTHCPTVCPIAGSDIGGPPGYTVTSPPPSTRDPTSPVPSAADLLTHSVKPAPDYKELNGDPQADHTVLLKVCAAHGGVWSLNTEWMSGCRTRNGAISFAPLDFYKSVKSEVITHQILINKL